MSPKTVYVRHNFSAAVLGVFLHATSNSEVAMHLTRVQTPRKERELYALL